MKNMHALTITMCFSFLTMILAGCSTSDGTLRDQGRSESYIMGFHDGRHTGMREAGNYLEHTVKDIQRFKDDAGPHPKDAMQDAMKGVNSDDLKAFEQYTDCPAVLVS